MTSRAEAELLDKQDPLAHFRHEFLIPDDSVVYLDGNSLGRTPLATVTRMKQVIDEDSEIYQVVRQIIVASLHGHPQPLVIEAARSGIAHHNKPSFGEVFDGLRGK